MTLDQRFTVETGYEAFTGNELLVKGALETPGGVHLLTGYPGSPVAGFFDALESIGPLLLDKGVVAKIANNEAISVAMVNGAQMAGCRAITAFKSVGLHVASDALALGVLAGTRQTENGESGGLIVIGDDSWSESTQVPTDSRFMAEHLRLPILEPACAQEVKDWVELAFKLGSAGQIYIGYSMQPLTADGGGTVRCRPNHFPVVNDKQKRALSYERDIQPHLEQTVLLPPRTGRREVELADRLNAVKLEARKLGINRIHHRPAKDEVVPLGFISYGVAHAYLTQALSEMGLTGRLPILRLGMAYPLDEQIVTDFAKHCQKIIVVEERRGFVQRQVVAALAEPIQAGTLHVEIYGKRFPGGLEGIPETRGLHPSMLVELLAPVLQSHPAISNTFVNDRLSRELGRINHTRQTSVTLVDRTPTFCPGCPHRDSSSVLLELRRDLRDPLYMLKNHRRKPVDLVCHGDTGCYTMLMFAPNEALMHNYSGMGLGGGTGSGLDGFVENKQLVFMGDGTFFHSGLVAISHSIKSSQDITYIILDNKTTAMTGHQSHAGTETDLRGQATFGQDIERIVTAMIPKELAKDVTVVRIDPADRDRYRKLLEQTLLEDGVKIVVADKECGITLQRRVNQGERAVHRAQGFLPKKTFMNVATEVCENCRECTTQTGCPGLKVVDTDHGVKIQTDLSSCVNDGACQRINACPSFEEVTILRKQAPRRSDEQVDLANIPAPARPIHAEQETWRCFLAGVGGMGIGLCTAILTAAGREMGYSVQFIDKKGLAIRNGGVCSQILFTRALPAEQTTIDATTHTTTPVIPYGKADLLLGVDILEAARAIDPNLNSRVAQPDRTAAVINTAKAATVLSLMGEEDFDVTSLERSLRQVTNEKHFVAFNVGDLCERMLDTRLYANIMMLGIAYQRGLLPLTGEALEKAMRSVIRHETARNLRAFAIGRRIAIEPGQFTVEPTHEVEPARKAFRRKVSTLRTQFGWFRQSSGRQAGREYRLALRDTLKLARVKKWDDELTRDVVIRAYDCYLFGGPQYARKYCELLQRVARGDSDSDRYALTRAVAWNLAKAMCIKDEVYVAALLTSPEKYKRDRKRFNVNPGSGDRIVYRHHNRPEFDVLGWKVRFAWRSTDWQLKLVSKLGFLRSLLPAWHAREKEFREWYVNLVEQMLRDGLAGPADRLRWVRVLSLPEAVTGYREVRYPKMDAARKEAAALLAVSAAELPNQAAASAFAAGSDIKLPPVVAPDADESRRTVSLPLFSSAKA